MGNAASGANVDKARVVRVWRTKIDPARASEYDVFARTKSVPMFRAQPGFKGVFFASDGSHRAVVTLWRDRAAVEALARSTTYHATVAEIEATGFLSGESSVELYDIDQYTPGQPDTNEP